jgi:hypothetical protein
MKTTLLVSFTLPAGATEADAADYVRAAVKHFDRDLWLPPKHPMRDINANTVTVVRHFTVRQ